MAVFKLSALLAFTAFPIPSVSQRIIALDAKYIPDDVTLYCDRIRIKVNAVEDKYFSNH